MKSISLKVKSNLSGSVGLFSFPNFKTIKKKKLKCNFNFQWCRLKLNYLVYFLRFKIYNGIFKCKEL